MSFWTILVFAALLAAGMSLMDTTDRAVKTRANGWAFVNPVRKIWYDLTLDGADRWESGQRRLPPAEANVMAHFPGRSWARPPAAPLSRPIPTASAAWPGGPESKRSGSGQPHAHG